METRETEDERQRFDLGHLQRKGVEDKGISGMKFLIILIATLTLLIVWRITQPQIVTGTPAIEMGSEKVKAAKRYHGYILFAENDGRGNLTFERDGQTCQLFTKAFEAWWRENAPIEIP